MHGSCPLNEACGSLREQYPAETACKQARPSAFDQAFAEVEREEARREIARQEMPTIPVQAK